MEYSVGIVIFDGISLVDTSMLSEAFIHAQTSEEDQFDLFTVGRNKEVTTADGGFQILPQHIYPDAHIYDVLLVPGGSGAKLAARNLRLMNWIRRASRSAKMVAAVNEGLIILAASQLLDGRQVAHLEEMTALFPGINSAAGENLVRDGKLLSAVGPSAGRALGSLVVEELGRS